MSSSSSEDDNIPPAEECERRCQEFAAITDTDTACAMFFLQDREWDVEKAINAYFEETGKHPSKIAKLDKAEASGGSGEASSAVDPVDPEPHRIRILSWNIDGLDTNNIKNRTKGICKIILEENPDVVFLQEVVTISSELLETLCPTYQLITAGKEGYFIAMMLKATSVVYKDHTVSPFYGSIMSRNLLHVKADVKGVEMELLTTHLESTASHADERKKQLQTCLKAVKEASTSATVMFGGDLNLRDKELQAIGGLPSDCQDMWEITGERPEAKYTWDLIKNDNLEWGGKFKPRCRFDRLIMRSPKGTVKPLKAVYFELVGIQRLTSCKRFPSDHWGILTHINKQSLTSS